MGRRFGADIWQGEALVASVDAPDEESCDREAAHYALVYGQDGPVEIVKWSSGAGRVQEDE